VQQFLLRQKGICSVYNFFLFAVHSKAKDQSDDEIDDNHSQRGDLYNNPIDDDSSSDGENNFLHLYKQ
jgi:hypothetical protein